MICKNKFSQTLVSMFWIIIWQSCPTSMVARSLHFQELTNTHWTTIWKSTLLKKRQSIKIHSFFKFRICNCRNLFVTSMKKKFGVWWQCMCANKACKLEQNIFLRLPKIYTMWPCRAIEAHNSKWIGKDDLEVNLGRTSS